MPRRETLALAVLVVVALLLAGCGRAPAVDSRTVPELTELLTPGPLDLVVLHTNDNWGETEPCG